MENIEKAKKDFLDRIVFRWMRNDIEHMLVHNVNMPLALCCLSYIEFLGSIISGKDNGNYNDANTYIHKCFKDNVKNEYNFQILKNIFRDALTHEYFGRGGISKDGIRPVIRKSVDGQFVLDAATLARDFLESLNEFRIYLEKEGNENFINRLQEREKILDARINTYGKEFFQNLKFSGHSGSSFISGITRDKYRDLSVSALNIGVKLDEKSID